MIDSYIICYSFDEYTPKYDNRCFLGICESFPKSQKVLTDIWLIAFCVDNEKDLNDKLNAFATQQRDAVIIHSSPKSHVTYFSMLSYQQNFIVRVRSTTNARIYHGWCDNIHAI